MCADALSPWVPKPFKTSYVEVIQQAKAKHIEAETKCRHFADDMHFLKWNFFNFKWYFIEMYSLGYNWQYSSIGSDHGQARNRQKAIIWINGLVY